MLYEMLSSAMRYLRNLNERPKVRHLVRFTPGGATSYSPRCNRDGGMV